MKVVIILVMAILGGAAYVGYSFWERENVQATPRSKNDDMKVVLEGRSAREPTGVPEGNNKYRGKYMTFFYPKTGTVVPSEKLNDMIVERADILVRDPRINISAAAMISSENRFEDLPAVKMRRNQKDSYQEKPVIVGVSEARVFWKLDGTEYSVFVFSGGRLYTLSATGTNKKELGKLWPELLSSFSVL